MNSSPGQEEFRKKLADLEQLKNDFSTFLETECSTPPNQYELRIIGSFLHDFYTGAEEIFKLIITRNEQTAEVLEGAKWHKEILDRMAEPIGTRDPLFGSELRDQLDEYRGFQHVFRNAYGAELKWKYMKPLVENFKPLAEKLLTKLKKFT